MGSLQAVYYRTTGGQEPVRSFIDELDVETQAALDNQIDRLNLSSDEIPHYRSPTARRSRASYASCAATTAEATTAFSTGAPAD
jgi:hypothetical protein